MTATQSPKTNTDAKAAYGVVLSSDTIRFDRVLPGPIERVWSYLVDSEKRSRWLAEGPMEAKAGGVVHLTWHNNALSKSKNLDDDPAPEKYAKWAECADKTGQVTAYEVNRLLAFTWGDPAKNPSHVTFELSPTADGKVNLTVLHQRLRDRNDMLSVSGGWHTHLDYLVAELTGEQPEGFWRQFARLEKEYDGRLPQS